MITATVKSTNVCNPTELFENWVIYVARKNYENSMTAKLAGVKAV